MIQTPVMKVMDRITVTPQMEVTTQITPTIQITQIPVTAHNKLEPDSGLDFSPCNSAFKDTMIAC